VGLFKARSCPHTYSYCPSVDDTFERELIINVAVQNETDEPTKLISLALVIIDDLELTLRNLVPSTLRHF
jgi:hypothetical protein